MKIKVALDNGAGELDSKTFEIKEGCSDEQEAVSSKVKEVLEGWTLTPGDTITIREIDQ